MQVYWIARYHPILINRLNQKEARQLVLGEVCHIVRGEQEQSTVKPPTKNHCAHIGIKITVVFS